MVERVAVVGSAQTKYERKKESQHYGEMVYETVRSALDNTGLKIEDIDTVVSASCDMLDGRSISNVFTAEAMGAFQKEESKVEEDGSFALLYAYMRLLSGRFGTAMVVAYSKGSESSPHSYTALMMEPFYQRPFGLDGLTSSALQARRYMDKYGITEEQAALVSVKAHKNARNNPYAQIKMDLTVEEVLRSEVLSSPIKKLDASPISDGCCVVIIASEEKAKKITDKPAWIKGVGHYLDAYYLGYRDLAEAESCRLAAQKAYQMAGIKDPLKEINVAEVYDAFSYQELMLYEALGFCEKGEGGKLMEKGFAQMDGELPVNPSGGVLSAHPFLAAGLARIAEAALQVSGKAKARQVPKAKTALAHGTSGVCLQANCVWILGR